VSQLVVSSPDGGEYICLLNGFSTAPQPKGPYKITAKPPPIDFKNPFFEPIEFTIRIDNPAFTTSVKSPMKVDGKKVLNINVSYKAAQGFSANGRMTISTGENLTWVFYLQGE
jgi:hydrocephalus-inducing protein